VAAAPLLQGHGIPFQLPRLSAEATGPLRCESALVEINANPWRLDLDWRWHQRCLELGCLFSINPDAHSVSELDLMRWGLAMARKGRISADRVLNALDIRVFSQWLADRRNHTAQPSAKIRARAHHSSVRWNPANASKRQPPSGQIRVIALRACSFGRAPVFEGHVLNPPRC
jgi:hypothetical protein